MDPITETHGRKLATIQKISKLSPIENSDFLEVAEMEGLGWKVVVKKGELKVGELVVYFEIDSAIRLKNLIQPLEFLKDKCLRKICDKHGNVLEELVRIKTIKLRGVISQGLIIPVYDFISYLPFLTEVVGDDVTSDFHVEHFDEICDYFDTILGTNVQSGCKRASDFPCWVPKTDEPRLQSFYGKAIEDPQWRDAEYEITEKFDGSSQTIFYCPIKWPDEAFKTASRRFILVKDPDSSWFSVFGDLNVFEDKLKQLYDNGIDGCFPAHHEYAIQGEHCGPKYNSNRDHYLKDVYKVFRIFDVTEQKFVSPDARKKICDFLNLDHVRVISDRSKIFHSLLSMDDFLNYVKGKTENGNEREGMVFKNVNDGFKSFKVINNDYLTKCDRG